MNRTYLSVGSNLGSREANLKEALDRLVLEGVIVSSVSAIYETTPWGFSAEGKFLNIVVEVDSALGAIDLLEVLLGIELDMGRKREGDGYSSRKIDMDIIFFNSEILESHELTIPHPRAHERLFVLIPMNELAPDYFHPVLGKSITELINECGDEEDVTIYGHLAL